MFGGRQERPQSIGRIRSEPADGREDVESSCTAGISAIKEAKKPKLAAHIDYIDEVLREDKGRPRKQRHTAKRIFKRLQEEREHL